MNKQYWKREYLGIKKPKYYLKYGNKLVIVEMEWVSGEYRILNAFESTTGEGYDPFPYRKTVAVIDRIEVLLK